MQIKHQLLTKLKTIYGSTAIKNLSADEIKSIHKPNFLEPPFDDQALISMSEKIEEIMQKWRNQRYYSQWVDQETAYLITYGDSIFEGNHQHANSIIKTLNQFANQYLTEIISDIHILPMYPWTSDDGFSVIDYRKIDSKLGDWEDLKAFSNEFNLMYDCVINHISASSEWFQGYLNGEEQYQNYFISSDPALDYSSITRPRVSPVLTPFKKFDGTLAHIWTTFSGDQIDLNFKSPDVLLESIDILLMYAVNGGRSIRLDAIGFIWKVIGTTSIHLPQAHAIIQLWRLILDEVVPGTLLITETNVPHQENVSYFGQNNEAHMVYQFSLPPLTLNSFLTGNSKKLTEWAKTVSEEANQHILANHKVTYFNFLASHDGIGMRPTEGILSDSEKQFMCDEIIRKGGRVSYKMNPDGTQSAYELNSNFLSAISEPTDSVRMKAQKSAAAHAILCAFTGVPAIYIHSLLGSENDEEGAIHSGINRRINRAKLSYEVLTDELAEHSSLRYQVFSKLSNLLRLRKQYAVFSPQALQYIHQLNSSVFVIQRELDPRTLDQRKLHQSELQAEYKKNSTIQPQSLISLVNISSTTQYLELPIRLILKNQLRVLTSNKSGNINNLDVENHTQKIYADWTDLISQKTIHTDLNGILHITLSPYQYAWFIPQSSF